MAFTNDFRNLLRLNRKKHGFQLGTMISFEEADVLGIIPERSRKKRTARFKKQRSSFPEDFMFTGF
jgi:hypothetical protein